MKKNNKGFTLVELIAVIVILIVILLFAITKVRSAYFKSKRNAVKANALSYVKALNNSMSLGRNEDKELDDGEYSLSQLDMFDINLDGTLPTGGNLNIENNVIISGCLDYEEYSANIISAGKVEVIDAYCSGEERSSGSQEAPSDDKEYSDTEIAYSEYGRYVYVVPKNGVYLLEAWGAQGGDSKKSSTLKKGGPGGYAYAEVQLEVGDEIYIYVGKKGTSRDNGNKLNDDELSAFNGGGKLCAETIANYNATGGGGATHISYSDNLLATSSINDIFIAAGGGGGASISSSAEYGDSGGGYYGSQSCSEPKSPKASQTTGAKYGSALAGYNCNYNTGGGGLYGGASCFGSTGSGSGGSGHINTNLINEGHMTCYNCTSSPAGDLQVTTSNTCVSETATADCAKLGDGAAHIKFLKS